MSELFDALLKAFAALHDLPADALLQTGEVSLGGTPVSLIYEGDEVSGEILFLGEIGKPLPGEELKMYAALLQGNNLWAGTGGATLALDNEDTAIACARLPIQGMDAAALTDVITEFATTVDYWRGFLTHAEG